MESQNEPRLPSERNVPVAAYAMQIGGILLVCVCAFGLLDYLGDNTETISSLFLLGGKAIVFVGKILLIVFLFVLGLAAIAIAIIFVIWLVGFVRDIREIVRHSADKSRRDRG